MASPHPPNAPRLSNGRFAVLSRLSRGDLSSTFAVHDTVNDARRAMVLLDPKALKADQRRQFEEGGRAMASVTHPNVLRVLEGRKARKMPYLLVELPGGGTLAHVLARSGPLDSSTVARVGAQLASALVAVHRAGFVHHQVQPSSIWVTPSGSIKLGEFELAMEDGSSARLERSPFRPRDAPAIADPHTDLYGVGATLVSLLMGDVVDAYPNPDAVAPCDAALLRIVRRCVAPAHERWASAQALERELADLIERLPASDGSALVGPPAETPVDRSDADLMLAVDRPKGAPPPSPEDLAEEKDVDWLHASPGAATPARALVSAPPPPPPPPPEPPPKTPEPARQRTPNTPLSRSRAPAPARVTKAPTPDRAALSPSQEARFRVDPEILRRRNRFSWVGTAVRVAIGLLGLGALAFTALVLVAAGALWWVAGDFDETATHADQARVALYAELDQQRGALDRLVQRTANPDAARGSFRLYLESTEPTKLRAALDFLDAIEAVPNGLEGGVSAEELERQKRVAEIRQVDQAYRAAEQAWEDDARTLTGRLVLALRLARPPPDR